MNSLFAPRIRLRDLAGLCRRLSIALTAGIDMRKVWQREAADASPASLRRHLEDIRDAVAHGESMGDAVARAGDYFPVLFGELVDVGEHTGNLAEVLRHLALHYEEQMKLRRSFVSQITGPLIQLGMALGVIGLLILVMGAIGGSFDMLGLGLKGTSGFITYCLYLVVFAAIGFYVYQAMRRGHLWTDKLQKAIIRLPAVGPAVSTISLAQMAWTMDITAESGMNLLKAVPLWFRSTRNAHFTQHTPDVLRAIRAGREIHESLAETGAFPEDFLATVAVGEESGRLPEAMKNLAVQYQDRAQQSLRVLTQIAGWVVWGLVALLIVMMIMRIAGSYVNMLNGFARDPMNYNP